MSNCPICTTQNENDKIVCQVCGWQLDYDKNQPNYIRDITMAKQSWQLLHNQSQLAQQLQLQNKAIERIMNKIDGLDYEMGKMKDSSIQNNISLPSKPKQDFILQPLDENFQKASDLNTKEKRIEWWSNLEMQWKIAFNGSFLNKGENTDLPTDEELLTILEAPTLRFAGPKAMFPNINFELTNLSGIQHLTNLQHFFCDHAQIKSVEEVKYLSKLESFFCNSNQVESINGVQYLTNLKVFYCNANKVTSLKYLAPLENLETVYCNYNELTTFEGISTKQATNLKLFYCLPNDGVSKGEIKRVEELGIDCKKG